MLNVIMYIFQFFNFNFANNIYYINVNKCFIYEFKEEFDCVQE